MFQDKLSVVLNPHRDLLFTYRDKDFQYAAGMINVS